MSAPSRQTFSARALALARTVLHHVTNHIGVGIVCAVAYFDPGNWSVDLQAGSDFHYRPMLFVVLLTGIGAIVLQTLSCKLGCVTGIDLASHCRLLLHDRPKHTRVIRYGVLYPLYALSEIAIISTDLAELLGSAIGFVIIIPSLPLWGGVLLTASDVLIFLAFTNPSGAQGRPVKVFEYAIILLVFAVFACFIALLVKAKPDWPAVFLGYIPNKDLFKTKPDAIYTAVGMLGATIMPHALFLGSSLATQDRVSLAPSSLPELPSSRHPSVRRPLKSRLKDFVTPLFSVSRAERLAASRDYRTKYGQRENNSLSFIRQHLAHGITDIVTSLLGIAVPINSAILVLAATVFYQTGGERSAPAGLFDAYDLIKETIGNAAAIIFALALICAGQAASITATLAGQIVSEGFIEWRISPFFRRLVTRLISMIPSVVVAVSFGREGINTLLIASQVALSVVLPFIAFPLIYLTSSEVIMRVRKPSPIASECDGQSLQSVPSSALYEPAVLTAHDQSILAHSVVEEVSSEKKDTAVEYHDKTEGSIAIQEYIDFSNGWPLTVASYFIWLIVLAANLYAIAMLALKRT